AIAENFQPVEWKARSHAKNWNVKELQESFQSGKHAPVKAVDLINHYDAISQNRQQTKRSVLIAHEREETIHGRAKDTFWPIAKSKEALCHMVIAAKSRIAGVFKQRVKVICRRSVQERRILTTSPRNVVTEALRRSSTSRVKKNRS